MQQVHASLRPSNEAQYHILHKSHAIYPKASQTHHHHTPCMQQPTSIAGPPCTAWTVTVRVLLTFAAPKAGTFTCLYNSLLDTSLVAVHFFVQLQQLHMFDCKLLLWCGPTIYYHSLTRSAVFPLQLEFLYYQSIRPTQFWKVSIVLQYNRGRHNGAALIISCTYIHNLTLHDGVWCALLQTPQFIGWTRSASPWWSDTGNVGGIVRVPPDTMNAGRYFGSSLHFGCVHLGW